MKLLPLIITLLVLCALHSASAADSRSEAKTAEGNPNILLILADDLGYGDVSCYNEQSKVPTPPR